MFKGKWYIHSEPRFYGSKPEKEIVINRFVRFYAADRFGNDCVLSEIIGKLPKNKKIEDIVVRTDHCHYDSDCDISLEFGFYDTEIKENPAYERQLEKYNKDFEEHKKEVKAWKKWKKEEEEKILQAQIRQAEAFLKKHGKL